MWIAAEYDNGKFHGALEGWDLDGKYFLSANYKKGFLQKKPPLPPGKRKIPKDPPDVKYVHEVTNTFLKIAKKEFGVTCSGSGSGMPFDVEMITVYLHIKKKGTVEEGRELFLRLTDRFVEVVNQHEKLRPYLREYPFTPFRANILLCFCDENGLVHTDGSVAYIVIRKDKQICYKASKPDKSYNDKYIFLEPYEEALKIVRSKDQKL